MTIKRTPLLFFVLIPFVVQLGLSLCGKYPIMSRIAAFYYPILLLSLCYVVNELWKYVKRWQGGAEPIMVLLVTGVCAFYMVQHPRSRIPGYQKHFQETKPLIATLQKNGREKDVLAASYSAKHALAFYGLQNRSTFVEVKPPHERRMTEEDAAQFISELRASHLGARMWIISSHSVEGYPVYLSALRSLDITPFENDRRPGAYLIGFNLKE